MSRHAFEFIAGGRKRQTGDVGDAPGGLHVIAGRCVEPCPHGRAADGQGIEAVQASPGPIDAQRYLPGIPRKLLPKGQGRGILKVGSADLDDVPKCPCFFFQSLMQMGKRRDEAAGHGFDGGDVHHRGKDVVGGLGHVHMVVGVNGALVPPPAAGRFNGPVGDHLVGVHVGLGAAAGLPDHQGKVIIQFPPGDLLGRRDDEGADIGIQHPQSHIGLGTGHFEDAQGSNHLPGHPFVTDGKVFEGALGLGPPVAGLRHRHFTHGIPLDSRYHDNLLRFESDSQVCLSRSDTDMLAKHSHPVSFVNMEDGAGHHSVVVRPSMCLNSVLERPPSSAATQTESVFLSNTNILKHHNKLPRSLECQKR